MIFPFRFRLGHRVFDMSKKKRSFDSLMRLEAPSNIIQQFKKQQQHGCWCCSFWNFFTNLLFDLFVVAVISWLPLIVVLPLSHVSTIYRQRLVFFGLNCGRLMLSRLQTHVSVLVISISFWHSLFIFLRLAFSVLNLLETNKFSLGQLAVDVDGEERRNGILITI